MFVYCYINVSICICVRYVSFELVDLYWDDSALHDFSLQASSLNLFTQIADFSFDLR